MKSFFPGIATLSERKRFAVFHAITFLIVILVVALILTLVRILVPTRKALQQFETNTSFETQLFENVRGWVVWSLFCWNIIGSIRFHDDAFDIDGGIFARAIVFLLLFGFPLLYFHNLFYIILHRRK